MYSSELLFELLVLCLFIHAFKQMRYCVWCIVITLSICSRWLIDVCLFGLSLSLKGGIYCSPTEGFKYSTGLSANQQ